MLVQVAALAVTAVTGHQFIGDTIQIYGVHARYDFERFSLRAGYEGGLVTPQPGIVDPLGRVTFAVLTAGRTSIGPGLTINVQPTRVAGLAPEIPTVRWVPEVVIATRIRQFGMELRFEGRGGFGGPSTYTLGLGTWF